MTLDCAQSDAPPAGGETAREAEIRHAISAGLAPLLSDLVAGEVERLRLEERRAARDDYHIVMMACAAVARAVDGLEQARFAGMREVEARRALDRAARQLRGVIRERSGR